MDTIKWVHFVRDDFSVVTFNPHTIVAVCRGRAHREDEKCIIITVSCGDDGGYSLADSQEFVVDQLRSRLRYDPASFLEAEKRAKRIAAARRPKKPG